MAWKIEPLTTKEMKALQKYADEERESLNARREKTSLKKK